METAKEVLPILKMLPLFPEMSGDEDSNLLSGHIRGLMDNSTLSVGGESGYDDAISDTLNDSIDHEIGNSTSNVKDEDDSFKITDDYKCEDGRDSAFADDMSLLSLQPSTR
jgi:hypothetical protein